MQTIPALRAAAIPVALSSLRCNWRRERRGFRRAQIDVGVRLSSGNLIAADEHIDLRADAEPRQGSARE
jgi:hypothetical protein